MFHSVISFIHTTQLSSDIHRLWLASEDGVVSYFLNTQGPWKGLICCLHTWQICGLTIQDGVCIRQGQKITTTILNMMMTVSLQWRVLFIFFGCKATENIHGAVKLWSTGQVGKKCYVGHWQLLGCSGEKKRTWHHKQAVQAQPWVIAGGHCLPLDWVYHHTVLCSYTEGNYVTE